MPECLTLGETMAAFGTGPHGPLRYVPNYSLRIAGAESNTAIGAAKLGVSAAWISQAWGRMNLGSTSAIRSGPKAWTAAVCTLTPPTAPV